MARAGRRCKRGRRDSQATVSVVFSFWNEAEVLPELIRRLRCVFDLLLASQQIANYELLFVNDASTDASEQVLRQAAQERSDIRIINMSRNFGVAPCVLAGLRYAQGDAVIYMDADLQDPPEVIPELIARWKLDPEVEVVHTVRQSRRGETAIKRAITALGYTALRAVSSIDLPREAGDFKLLSRRVVDLLLQLPEQRPFMRGLVCWLGFKQDFVYYHREPRAAGRSKFPVLGLKVLRNFFDSALISFSDVPLKLAGWLGSIALAVGLLLATLVAGAALVGEGASSTLMVCSVVLVVGGAQLACLGVFGRYLAGVYFESKRRPRYIVRDTFGFPSMSPVASDNRRSSSDRLCC
jgi:glycosyltransferase involved in cell wall biosynthesis